MDTLSLDINVCLNCGLIGYEYEDAKRKLCHLCIAKEKSDKQMADELTPIFEHFMENDFRKPGNWPFIEFGKAAIGNAIIMAIQNYQPDWKPFKQELE